MATVKMESLIVGRTGYAPFLTKQSLLIRNSHFKCVSVSSAASVVVRASSSSSSSQSMEADNNKLCKELGLFSLKKKIDDVVLRAEMFGPQALELEESRQIKQEEMLHHYNLWDDVTKSSEMLTHLADTTKVVDNLKDLRYKAEEAKLITQLADMDAINYRLFKQAYTASVDVSKLLDHYELSKLLSGPYDADGACITIRAGSEGICSEVWAERILSMYLKWAEKQGYKGRLVETYPSENGGVKSATIDFELEYAYGYLSGERGAHRKIKRSSDESILLEDRVAFVDVIPLFLQKDSDLQIDEEDLVISSSLQDDDQSVCQSEPAISIRHIPTGISVESSGERSRFANKTKAINRLKAKLLVIAKEQGVSHVKNIKINAIVDVSRQESRKYIFHPHKLVQDVKTGIQLPDLNSVMDGNIEPLIGAHISSRLATGRV
ncbi:hypothetical protein IFM89_036967 [Coptis chinensis]|uniref:Peptide chain release factor domain-containing protein n=1 Tax=Coptis chinensis TaxID=261450 RepID=A0A835HDV8_9MAGN|nr:hypothetical protein IFM89_036967 [Coptis chinensis]